MCFVTHRSVAQDPFNFHILIVSKKWTLWPHDYRGKCSWTTSRKPQHIPTPSVEKWLLVIASTYGAFITCKGRSAHKCAESFAKSCKGNGPNMAQQLLAMANWRAEMKCTTVGLLTTVCDYLKFLGWSNGALYYYLYWTWHASWEYLRTCQSRAGSLAGLVPGSGQEARRASCLHVFYCIVMYCHRSSSYRPS